MNERCSREKNTAIWDRRYGQGKSILQYPEDIFVRVAHHKLDPDEHKRILDYGFGAGANMLHLLRRGFEVAGVEPSLSAIEYVKKMTEQANFKVSLKNIGPDGKIPFADECFHGVIAWEVLLYNDFDGLSRAVDEINRVLRPGGIFLGTMRAPGDPFQSTAIPLGEGLFEMTVEGQEGAIIVVPEREELSKLFKAEDLKIGKYDAMFENIVTKNWILMYQKANH